MWSTVESKACATYHLIVALKASFENKWISVLAATLKTVCSRLCSRLEGCVGAEVECLKKSV